MAGEKSNYRILIVDDNPVVRGLYRRLLSNCDDIEYEFAEASSAEEGLSLFRQINPDCILVDYGMPRMNGLEFLAQLAGSNGFVPVPVVMITGQGDERLAVAAMKRGAADYLVKNCVTQEALRLAVSNALNEAESQRRVNHQQNRFSGGALLNMVPGSLIDDRFTIVRCVGAGSMGKVYLCRDEELGGLPIAMKVLFSDISQNEEDFKRFKNEILAAYTVSHRNVVRAFQYFVRDDVSAFTMEYVNGGSLADKLNMSGKLSIAESLDFLKQICIGVQAIHDSGIIHRDLKPSNVLITTEGEVKISDFGIARMESVRGTTQRGEVLGTLGYVSPEYLTSAEVSIQSDIYSIGIIGYEMVTGLHPDNDMNFFDAIKKRVEEDPETPMSLRADCPQKLSDVIMRALKRQPRDRFMDAREMFHELESINLRSPQ